MVFLGLLFALGLALGSSGALSEVYRWKDGSGKVHFGDRPGSTDPTLVKEIAIPSPNLATGFKAAPVTSSGSPTKALSGGETYLPSVPLEAAPDAKSKPAPKLGFAARTPAQLQSAKRKGQRAKGKGQCKRPVERVPCLRAPHLQTRL